MAKVSYFKLVSPLSFWVWFLSKLGNKYKLTSFGCGRGFSPGIAPPFVMDRDPKSNKSTETHIL